MSFSADDAEARRGGKVRTTKERAAGDDHTSTKRKSDDEQATHGADDAGGGVYVPRVRSREAARGSDSVSDADGRASTRRYTPRPRAASAPVADIDVPGCPTGMICTVCLAGCAGEIGGIIDAQAKTPPPQPND